MLTAALALILSPLPSEVSLEPTDDAWVYQFAEDQASDEFLRVWGGDEGAVGKSFEGHLAFSYSCLKFKVQIPLPGETLKSAKLVLVHTPEAGWDPANAEKNPLEVRALTGDWNEKDWTFETALKVHPSADTDTIYGTGWAKPPSTDQTFKFEIDLMKGPKDFKQTFGEAVADPNHVLELALTSRMQPDQAGEGTVYKFYSRNNDPDMRPKLVLTFESK